MKRPTKLQKYMFNTNISISEDRKKRRRRMKTRSVSDDSTRKSRVERLLMT